MAAINPYITFLGNCEEEFNYYKSVFGGEFNYVGKFKDMPSHELEKMSQLDGNKIMHISLPLGEGTVLMGSDAAGEWGAKTIVGNNFSVAIKADSKKEAEDLFVGLSADGVITMPLESTFWGDYFGMCTDKFGINWMVSFDEVKKD